MFLFKDSSVKKEIKNFTIIIKNPFCPMILVLVIEISNSLY